MPPADNSSHLVDATRRRSAHARKQAERVIAAAHDDTQPVNVAAIAKSAGVSRSWLYTQPDLIAAIRQIQHRQPAPVRTGPQPASAASLQNRLDTALSRIKQLRADNAALTRQLETAFGEIRRLSAQTRPAP
jgi:hypothetical protein